jgi:hypothetical protein
VDRFRKRYEAKVKPAPKAEPKAEAPKPEPPKTEN